MACFLWPCVFHALGLYATQHLSGLEEFRRTAAAVGIGVVVLILLAFWSNVYVSRQWVAITLVIALVLELSTRMLVRARVARQRTSGFLTLRTLVIGRGSTSRSRSSSCASRFRIPASGLDRREQSHPGVGETPASDRVRRLRVVFRHYRPDCIFIASTTIGPKQMFAVMQAARQEGVVVKIYTDLSGVWVSRLAAQPLGKEGVALTIRPAGLSTSQRFVKRTMDLVLATIALIVVSPILFLAAIAVKVTSAGPVLFRQERVTEGARTFVMYKFRTMAKGAEQGAKENAVRHIRPLLQDEGAIPD